VLLLSTMKILVAILSVLCAAFVFGVETTARALFGCSVVASLVTGLLPGSAAHHPRVGAFVRALHRFAFVRWRDEFGTFKWPGMGYRPSPYDPRAGKRAYGRYGRAVDWITVRSDVMLDWSDQSPEVMRAWNEAARGAASGGYEAPDVRPRFDTAPRVGLVKAALALSENEYDALAESLLADHPEWFGALDTNGDHGPVYLVRVTAPNRNPFYVDPGGYAWARNVYFDARACNDWRAKRTLYLAPDFADDDAREVTVRLGGHKVNRLAVAARNLPDVPRAKPSRPSPSPLLTILAVMMLASCAWLRNATMDATDGIPAREPHDTRAARCNGNVPEHRHAEGRFWTWLPRRGDGGTRACPGSCAVIATDAGDRAICVWPDAAVRAPSSPDVLADTSLSPDAAADVDATSEAHDG